MAKGVCQQFQQDGVVCPPKTRHGLFTIGAVDNIDYNPSTATAKDSFHGTGISLMQQPTHDFPGIERDVTVINASSSGTVIALPPKDSTGSSREPEVRQNEMGVLVCLPCCTPGNSDPASCT